MAVAIHPTLSTWGSISKANGVVDPRCAAIGADVHNTDALTLHPPPTSGAGPIPVAKRHAEGYRVGNGGAMVPTSTADTNLNGIMIHLRTFTDAGKGPLACGERVRPIPTRYLDLMSNESTNASANAPHDRPGVTLRNGAARLRVLVAPCRKCGAASAEGSIYCEPCEDLIIGAAVRSWCNDIRTNTAKR